MFLKIATRKYKTTRTQFQGLADQGRHPTANADKGLEKRHAVLPIEIPQCRSRSSSSWRQPYALELRTRSVRLGWVRGLASWRLVELKVIAFTIAEGSNATPIVL